MRGEEVQENRCFLNLSRDGVQELFRSLASSPFLIACFHGWEVCCLPVVLPAGLPVVLPAVSYPAWQGP
jgi:hypothetical protein